MGDHPEEGDACYYYVYPIDLLNTQIDLETNR